MAVYYKFKSAKDYDSISIDGHFISVANLKERIFESKHLGRGTDFDLVVTNAQTNEEYIDEAMLIPKNTSVLIRRVPGRSRMPIVTQPNEPKLESNVENDQPAKSNFTAADTSVLKDLEAEWEDEFGNDLYATIPEVAAGQSGNPMQDTAPPSKADEDSKIKALIENSVFDWQRESNDGFGPGRGFGRGGRGGRGFGRGGFERKTPPPGYVCHRCKVSGHFIQHCPTNGDPNFDIRKVKPPTGIPKSMLVATPDGSYALPSGTSAVLKPNEAAFEKEIEGLPSTRSVGDLPPELHCPLCKEVMKDAVLTSKCCFTSFCDKCIRDYIISRSMCVCGARDMLADDLLPNKTLRDTINRILESGNSSADNAGSALHIQDMESARCSNPKFPSPTQSAASRGEQKLPPHAEETSNVNDSAVEEKIANFTQQQVQPQPQLQPQPQASDRMKSSKVPDASVATHESASVKEHVFQSGAQLTEEEVQQKVAVGEAAKKKKKKKKVPMPVNGTDMQWMGGNDGFMGPPAAFNPMWGGGMQPPMENFMAPFPGNMPYNMGYGGLGPMDMPFGNFMPPDPFGGQGFMFPPMMPPPLPPQRDLAAEFGMGMNVRPSLMSREEFEARKGEVRRKREMERQMENNRNMVNIPPPKEREYGREVNRSSIHDKDRGDLQPMKSKPKAPPVRRSPSQDRYDHDRERGRERERASLDRDRERERDREYHHRRSSHNHRSDPVSPDRSSRDPELPRPSLKRKSDHRDPDYDHDHHRDREREREREHRTHRRSEPSASKPPPPSDPSELVSQGSKRSVFSRISFPEEDITTSSKNRKVSAEPKPKSKPNQSSKDHGIAGSESDSGHRHHHHHHHKSSPSVASRGMNGYHETTKKSMAAPMDYESSDDERHFKRKPSRYERSPPPPPPPRQEKWMDEDEDGRRHSRDRKHR